MSLALAVHRVRRNATLQSYDLVTVKQDHIVDPGRVYRGLPLQSSLVVLNNIVFVLVRSCAEASQGLTKAGDLYRIDFDRGPMKELLLFEPPAQSARLSNIHTYGGELFLEWVDYGAGQQDWTRCSPAPSEQEKLVEAVEGGRQIPLARIRGMIMAASRDRIIVQKAKWRAGGGRFYLVRVSG